MNLLWTVRIVAFVVMIGIAAGSLSPYIRLVKLLSILSSDIEISPGTEGFPTRHFDWLGILSGLLTVVSLTVMAGLDLLKEGMITSIIAVEFAWLTIPLWGFWIATAVSTVQASHAFSPCGTVSIFNDDRLDPFCSQLHTAEGLSIVMCVLLPLYPFALAITVFAVGNKTMSASRMWMSTVRETF